MITKVLRCLFLNVTGKVVTLMIPNARDTITDVEARAAMQTILDSNVFNSPGGSLVAMKGAALVVTDRTDLFTEN